MIGRLESWIVCASMPTGETELDPDRQPEAHARDDAAGEQHRLETARGRGHVVPGDRVLHRTGQRDPGQQHNDACGNYQRRLHRRVYCIEDERHRRRDERPRHLLIERRQPLPVEPPIAQLDHDRRDDRDERDQPATTEQQRRTTGHHTPREDSRPSRVRRSGRREAGQLATRLVPGDLAARVPAYELIDVGQSGEIL